MYSNYQRRKEGLLSRNYNEVDVVIEKEKLNKIISNYNDYDDRLKILAEKHIKIINQNIEFLCRMINQQNMENAK